MTNVANTIWILMCGCLVFFMQAGFTCLEAGIVQNKNVISVAIENLLTFMLTVVCFCLVGFPLMFGLSAKGIIGTSLWGFVGVEKGNALGFAFVFLQLMFAATSTTIFAGAMSERTKLKPLLIATVVSALLIYPVFGHWVWGGMFLHGQEGWLKALGFMDFAGASVVHMTAGGIALAGVIVVGKRKNNTNFGSNIPLATLGVFILIFGWLGFNGASTTGFEEKAGLALMNTIIAGAFGMGGAILVNILNKKKGGYLISIFNGVLGGLVAITACSYYCMPLSAMILGFVAGIVVDLSKLLLTKLGADDTVNVVPVHLIGGIVGCVLMPFLIQSEYLMTESRMAQFGIQCVGVIINFAWVFTASYIMFKILDRTIGLRVTEEEEEKGLNIVEFEDIISWENHMAITGYENQIGEKNELLRKQARLLTVTEEQENKKLARDIHDGMGQSLAALKLMLGINKKQAMDIGNEQLIKTTEKATKLVETSINEMRSIINNMKPEDLEEKGLLAALTTMTEKLNSIDEMKFLLVVKDEIPIFEETVMVNIYRVIQEAATNVVKHSKCSEANIVCYKKDETFYAFGISDNGIGFPVANKEFGEGIPSMGDRIKMVGGYFHIYSSKGKGTRVVAEVPFNE